MTAGQSLPVCHTTPERVLVRAPYVWLTSATKLGENNDFRNTILNAKNVLRIMSATLLIPAILDVVSGYLGFRIPRYATATLLTLFMYACEADANAQRVAEFLRDHAKVRKVHYLPFLGEDTPAGRVFRAQCSGAGSTFSFDIEGGEKAAFAFLNALQVFKLAVSLGGTESLASHPAAMTHSGVPIEVRERIGVLDSTIRLSIGVEHPDDLIADLAQALAQA